jgi:hypothetical protein
MPFIRSLTSTYYTLLAILICLNSEIISPYSCYTKKGLVYIAIIAPFNYQLLFYFKYTKANTRFFCDVHLISINKYISILLNEVYSLSQLLNKNI